jgi:lysophospholipase L1-like esterase
MTAKLALACLVASALSTIGLIAVASNVAGADSASPFYLALGGSASVGVQPTINSPKGAYTAQGYANDVVSYEASRGLAVQLTQLGCPGETTTTMLYGGGHCYPADDSQLAEAVAFLQAHRDDEGLVTIDLGFNNIRPCLMGHVTNKTCVIGALDSVDADLPTILTYLKNAAGPKVIFVGVGHYDPFLASALAGPSGRDFALASSGVVNRLNDALQNAYAAENIPMADVASAFDEGGVVHQHTDGAHTAASDVVYACELTWMCQAAPYGPNIHPNAAGYATIAASIEAQLRTPW